MGDHINVAIRIRPLNQRELRSSTNGTQSILPWVVQRDTITQRTFSDGRVSTGNSFTFDRVFDQKESTLRVYDDVVKQIITSSMNGFNGTIFAYGQTSSGKTHTMHGNDTELGIIKLAVNEMFRIIECDPDREYLIRVSFLEIYNEVLRDLLEPSKSNLKIHENAKREIFVGDLSEHIVFNVQQVEEVLQKGDRNRHVAGTNMNERSSRSHTIFRIIIESREKADAENEDCAEGVDQAHNAKRQQRLSTGSTDESAEFTGAVKVSCLNLVDLAGSERVGQTGAEGQRLKEGAHINKSLMSLGTVIARLSEDGGDKGHIPYRDSKLTRILQPSIGGNAKTLIVCTITPSPDYVDEALSTLKFASRAKTIQNKPEVNEELRGDALLRRLKRASELEKEVAQMKDIERKKLKIEADNEQLLRQLWKSQKERERLQKELDIQQSNMFLPKNADSKNAVDAVPSFRRQTWFPGLQKPLGGGESEPSSTITAVYPPERAIEMSADAMDTDDNDTPCQTIDSRRNNSIRKSSDNGSSSPGSEAAPLDPEFNQLVTDKLGDLEASNAHLQQQNEDLASANKDMEETIQRVMREYSLLLKTLNQLAIADTIPPSPAKPSPVGSQQQQQQQPYELMQIRRKLRALMMTIDASQKQCQKFRSQRPEAEFLEMELQAVRETLVQKEEQLVDTLNESDEVFSRLTELEGLLAESEGMCQLLRTELTTAKESAESFAHEGNALRLQLDTERQRLDELSRVHKEDVDQILAKAISEHGVEINSLQKQLEYSQKTSSEYEGCISRMNDELSVARDQISRLSVECKSLADVRTEVTERDLAIKELTEQLQNVRIELSESNSRLGDLESRFTEQTKELELKSTECDESTQRVGQLTTSIAHLTQQLAERDIQFAAAMSKAQEELGAANDMHTAEKMHLESLADERAKGIGELQKSVRALSEQLKEAKGERQELMSQLSLANNQANAVPALAEEVSNLRHEIDLLGSSSDRLKELLSKKQEELEASNIEKEHLHAKNVELESQNADVWERVSELTVANSNLSEKITDSEKVEDEHKNRVLQLETASSELAATRDSLIAKLESLSDSHKVALIESDRSMAQLQAELDSMVARIERLESELRSSKESAASASSSNEMLIARCAELDCLLSGERDKIGALQKDLDTQTRKQSERLSLMASEHASQLNAAKECEHTAREDIARLEDSLASTRAQLSSLQTDMAVTDKNKSSIVQLNAELSANLESQSATITELESHVASLQITAANAQSEKENARYLYDLVKRELADADERAKKHVAELESAVSMKSRELEEAMHAKDELIEQLKLSDASKTENLDRANALQAELDSANTHMSRLLHDHESLVVALRQELSDHQQRTQEQLDQINKSAVLAEESRLVAQRRLDELELSYDSVTKQLEETERSKSDLLERLQIQQNLADNLSASAGDSAQQIVDIKSSHRTAIAALEDKLGVVEAERDRLVSSIHDVTDSLDTANLEIERLQASIRALCNDHQAALKESAAANKLADTRKSELELDIVKVQRHLSDTSTENGHLQSRLLAAEEQNVQLLSQLDNARVALKDGHVLEQRLKGQVAQLELQLEDQSRLLADMKEQLSSSRDASAEQIKDLQVEMDKVCAELRTQTSRINDMAQQLCKAQEDVSTLSSERDCLQKERDGMALRAKEAQAQLEQSISELKGQINSKSIEIQELETALENANSVISSSQKDISESEQGTVNELSVQVKTLTEERDRAHSDIGTLKGMMTELARVKNQDISELEEKLAQFEELLETSINENLEKDKSLNESKALVSKHSERAKRTSDELEAVLAQHEVTVGRFSAERSEIQSRLDAALTSADELRAQKIDMDAELKRLQDKLKDVDIDLYGSLSVALQDIVKTIQSLPGCENMAELVVGEDNTPVCHRKLLDAARELLAAAVTSATERALAESKTPDLAQLENELKRLRVLNEKLEEKSRMLMDAYKHDMGELRAEEESQRQSAETLRRNLDKQIERAKELESDLAKAQDHLKMQTEQRVALETRVNRITADVAVSPKTPMKPAISAQIELSPPNHAAAPNVVAAHTVASQRAGVARLVSQRTPVKSSNKRTHISSREADDLSPAKVLSPMTSSALNARANATDEDAQIDKYPPRKRTPAASAALPEKALEIAPPAKAETTRGRSSYGDRRRIRRNQPPPPRKDKDGLEEQAAEQCVQQ